MTRFLAIFALAATLSPAQSPLESIVNNRLVVIYRAGVIPTDANTRLTQAGAHLTSRMDHFGMVAVSTTDPAAQSRIAAQPNVAAVLHDRLVSAKMLMLRPSLELPAISLYQIPAIPSASKIILYAIGPKLPIIIPFGPTTDTDYASPQGWAVQSAGGFGDNIPNGSLSPSTGPWNISKGAGIRIAVLDSGVDASHPDITPNLALNLSEVDQTALPSPCDTGSPQDQSGHGTWLPLSPPEPSAQTPA
jgi:hypothetical protein